jgi:hypothetical protein
MIKEYSWITGHLKDCSMEPVGIVRSEIMARNAVIPVLSRKPRKNGRKHCESQDLEQRELRIKQELKNSKHHGHRAFGELQH